MEVKFGADATAITDAEQLEEAAWALVEYREGYGLESLIYYDEPHYPLETFQECTIYTQLIGVVYANYLVRNCCDARPDNLQPFLDRLGQFVLDQADWFWSVTYCEISIEPSWNITDQNFHSNN